MDSRIVSGEMKPVFALAQKYLFTESYSAGNNNAREDARAGAEVLKTIREFTASGR